VHAAYPASIQAQRTSKNATSMLWRGPNTLEDTPRSSPVLSGITVLVNFFTM